MPAPSSGSTALLNIPQKDLAVTSYTGKARIFGGDGYVKDRVAMCFVSLDRGYGFDGGRRVFGIAGYATREVDGAV
jgi:hypothetical protein